MSTSSHRCAISHQTNLNILRMPAVARCSVSPILIVEREIVQNPRLLPIGTAGASIRVWHFVFLQLEKSLGELPLSQEGVSDSTVVRPRRPRDSRYEWMVTHTSNGRVAFRQSLC